MGKIERRNGILAVFSKYDDVVLKVKRQLDTSKSTTSEEQTVDLLRSKSSISKLEIVDFGGWNRRFALPKFVRNLHLVDNQRVVKRQNFALFWVSGDKFQNERISEGWNVKNRRLQIETYVFTQPASCFHRVEENQTATGADAGVWIKMTSVSRWWTTLLSFRAFANSNSALG